MKAQGFVTVCELLPMSHVRNIGSPWESYRHHTLVTEAIPSKICLQSGPGPEFAISEALHYCKAIGCYCKHLEAETRTTQASFQISLYGAPGNGK